MLTIICCSSINDTESVYDVEFNELQHGQHRKITTWTVPPAQQYKHPRWRMATNGLHVEVWEVVL